MFEKTQKTRTHRDVFLQAEDRIRDAEVTGVQTCALPICNALLLIPLSSLVMRSPRQFQLNRPGAECIVERVSDAYAGENQRHRTPVGTDPLRRQAVTMRAGDNPRAGALAGRRGVVMEDSCPRTPRLRRVEDSPVAGGIIGERQQIALDSGVINHVGTAAIPGICEHGAGKGDVRGPCGAPVLVQVLEKLPRGPVRDTSLGNARQNQSIVAFVRTGTVLRIAVDEIVARAAIIASEIQESGRAEAGLKLKTGFPVLAVILRP